jgi:hypothetical protein
MQGDLTVLDDAVSYRRYMVDDVFNSNLLGLTLDYKYLRCVSRDDDTSTLPLSRMINSLREAAENRLNALEFPYEMVIPAVTFEAQRKLANSVNAGSPHTQAHAHIPPAFYAAKFYGIGQKDDRQCTNDTTVPAQLFLALEYSKTAIEIVVGQEQCGGIVSRLSTNYFLANWSKYNVDTKASFDPLEAYLQGIMSMTIQHDGEEVGLKDIREFMIFGEMANDQRLHNNLRKVLGGLYQKRIKADVDPLYAASRGVAYNAWYRAKFHDYSYDDSL